MNQFFLYDVSVFSQLWDALEFAANIVYGLIIFPCL